MKQTKHHFIRFLGLMGNRIYIYAAAILTATIAHALIDVVGSYIYKDFCSFAERGSSEGIIEAVSIKLIIVAIMCFLNVFFIRIYNIEAKRATATVQKTIFDKAMRLPMSYYENHHSGDLVSKIIYDANSACEIYTGVLRRFLAPIISIVVYFIPMLCLCPQVTLCLFGINLVALVINSLMAGPMKKVGVEASKSNSKMTEALSNVLQGIDIIKMYDAKHQTVKRYQEENKDYVRTQKKFMFLNGALDSMNKCFDLICALAFLAVGVFFVEKGITTIGNLAAIYTMYGMFSWNFLQMGKYYPVLMNCLAYVERIFEFLEQEEEPTAYKTEIKQIHYDMKAYIDFSHITFGYNEERMILEDISMQIKKGKAVALTGETGRGKSTVAKLLLGFYGLNRGDIYINGESINKIGLEQVRHMIAYVPQEPYLFNMSIKENIRYGRLDATEEEIIEAAKIANAHGFILRQAEGYDTIVGERGGNLSGGERQRIAIARAILRNAPILLLDEATSALDNESEQLVQEALNHLMADRTTIMIAHRPTTIALADEEIKICS